MFRECGTSIAGSQERCADCLFVKADFKHGGICEVQLYGKLVYRCGLVPDLLLYVGSNYPPSAYALLLTRRRYSYPLATPLCASWGLPLNFAVPTLHHASARLRPSLR